MDPCQHLMRRMAFDLGMSPGLVTTAIIGVFWRLLPRRQGSEAFGRSGTLASSASATPKGGAAYESCIARRSFRSRSLAVMLLRPSWFLSRAAEIPLKWPVTGRMTQRQLFTGTCARDKKLSAMSEICSMRCRHACTQRRDNLSRGA